jgi:hypothetical protein
LTNENIQLGPNGQIIMPDDELASGCTLANPVACSGAFIRSSLDGSLPQLIAICEELQQATTRKKRLERQLRQLNNPCWLSHFAKRIGEKNFALSLTRRAERLEAQLAAVTQTVRGLVAHLECADATIVSAFQNDPVSLPSERARTRAMSCKNRRQSALDRRRRMILRFSGQSHLNICHELDEAFPPPHVGVAPEFPATWSKRFGVRTFAQAYHHPLCRKLVHRLLSGAKA